MTAAGERWRQAAATAGRELTVNVEPAAARCGAAGVEHVLDVLIDNALKHGRGPISVRCARLGERAIVDVSDAGTTPSSTDAFADTDSDSPHGIGLRLARTLAESADGELDLLDAPTTTFRLTLPAALDTAPGPQVSDTG